MNCPQIQKLIHPHHDGELDAANTLLVDEHLADCPACFDLSRRLSTLRGAPCQNPGAALHRAHRFAEQHRRGRSGRTRGASGRPCRTGRGSSMEVGRPRRLCLWRRSWRCISPPRVVTIRWSPKLSRAMCAFADGRAPHGCRLDRPAHGQAVVRRQTGLRAAGERLPRWWISAPWRAGWTSSMWQLRRGAGLRAAQALPESFSFGLAASPEPTASRLHPAPWLQCDPVVGWLDDLRGGERSQQGGAARVRGRLVGQITTMA